MPYKAADPTLFLKVWLGALAALKKGEKVEFPCETKQEANRLRFNLNSARLLFQEAHPELYQLTATIVHGADGTTKVTITSTISAGLLSTLTKFAFAEQEPAQQQEVSAKDLQAMLGGLSDEV